MSLLVQLAQIYVAKEGLASAEASDAFAKALAGIDATDNAVLRVAIYYGTWIAPYIGDRLKKAEELANHLVEEMENESDTIPRLISRRMRAATLIAMGRSPEALADLKISYALYEASQITDFAARFAQDPGVQIWSYELLALWMTGRDDEAVSLTQKAMERARELNHANTICYAGLHAVTLAFWRGDVEGGRAVNEEMRRIAFEHDMALWKIYCSLHEAELACMEDGEDAAGKLDAALDDYKESGCGLWITLYLAEQAKFHLRRDDLDSARKSIARARDEMDESGEEWAKSELCRIEGEIHLREGNRERAKKVFEGAIEIARYQDAQALELAAMHALERLANNVG